MKCYTLSEDAVSTGIGVKQLPHDDTLNDDANVDSMRVVAAMPERDGIDPEELFSEDFGRATACCPVIFSKAEEDTDGRMLVAFDPRKWTVRSGGCLVYRSREVFVAAGMDETFTLVRVDGKVEMKVTKDGPVVESNEGSKPKKLPSPDDGWFLATIE